MVGVHPRGQAEGQQEGRHQGDGNHGATEPCPAVGPPLEPWHQIHAAHQRDGVKHYATEIVADDMKLLGRRSDNPQQGGYQQPAQGGYQQPAQGGYQQSQNNFQQPQYQQPAQPQAPVMPNDDPDDLPF